MLVCWSWKIDKMVNSHHEMQNHSPEKLSITILFQTCTIHSKVTWYSLETVQCFLIWMEQTIHILKLFSQASKALILVENDASKIYWSNAVYSATFMAESALEFEFSIPNSLLNGLNSLNVFSVLTFFQLFSFWGSWNDLSEWNDFWTWTKVGHI